MPSKQPKVEVSAEAAPRPPRLPDELWEKIFRDVAQDEDADLAALRLVNKYCAKMYAHRQYGHVVRRMCWRKRQWRMEECNRKIQEMQDTTVSALHAQQQRRQRDRLRSRCDGEVVGDIRMERFIWELGANPLLTTEAMPFLTACISALRELGY